MDLITGTGVAVAIVVPLPRERVWELVTAVERVGEWSPEATGGRWCDESPGPAAGARFIATNRYPNGSESTVTCIVSEARERETFAWDVLDDAGATGSSWRYDLTDGSTPGSTVVRQSFRHGPGTTGARAGGEMGGRLTALCSNMMTTITAMTGVAR
ncbi:SRPBCC family protein [Actinoplanes sp. CA-252034]|uniref:SRPBCC family protein n=1 Tax=Actinoplanes sp. CA-252034 TaxID=3239906 RepID=UPI003D95F5DF